MTMHSQDPRAPNRHHPQPRSGFSPAMMLGLAIGVLVALGIVWFATSNRTGSMVNAPAFERSVPGNTTGQSRTNVIPSRDQNVPNPTTSSPPTPAR